MLGELIAREIRQIEHEKVCKCPGCEVTQANRKIDMFVASHDCECPVCQIAKAQLQDLGEKLARLHNTLVDEHDRLDPVIAQETRSPEQETEIRNLAGLEGGVLYAAKIIRNVAQTYNLMIEAAHEAYDLVAQGTSASNYIEVLRRLRDHIQNTNERPDSRTGRETPDPNSLPN